MNKIKFVVRDCNGKWLERKFNSRDEVYKFCKLMSQDEMDGVEDVMYITIDGVCVYSSLMATVDWEDLVGWFA